MKKQGKKWMLVVLALLAVVTVALPLVGCKNDSVSEQTGDGTGSGDGNQGTGDGTGSGSGNQGSGDGNQGSGDPEQPVTYTVSFYTNGGGSIDSQPIVNGQTATKPADPTLENNVFGGWYSDEELTSEYDFTTPVTGSFTLYAKWVEGTEVTANNVSSVIAGLTGEEPHTLVVTGELNDLSAITTALSSNNSAKVNLDLSKATGLTSIGPAAFEGCRGLTSISIPEGVEIIGGDAFYECRGLTSINIPSSVEFIGGDAFFGCYSLTSIDLSKATGLTTIGNYAFHGCKVLTSISIPSSVTSIGDVAFGGCSSLTSISIPEGVTSIGNHAFDGCRDLTSISIPSSVEIIREAAFQGCSELTTVTMKATTPPELGSSAFSNTSTGLQILVPNVDNYTNEDAKEKGWEPYKDKIIDQTS